MSGIRPEPGPSAEDLYDANYYAHRLGEPYTRANPVWMTISGRVAEFIVETFAPQTVLDAGCGIGFLVEALRDRGVDARGIDISRYAVSQVPEPLRPYVAQGSVTDELEGHYDLITCIEVLEHLPPEPAAKALDNLSRHASRIIFSSSPYDTTEPTHVNVLRPEDWVRLFAERGFHPVPHAETVVISPQAMVLERAELDPTERLGAYESVRCELAHRLSEREETLKLLERRVQETEAAGAASARGAEEAQERAAPALERALAAEREARQAERAAQAVRETAARVEAELAELRSTTWWRVGAPVRAAVTFVRVRMRPLASSSRPERKSHRSSAHTAHWTLRAGRRLPAAVRHRIAARFPATVERLVEPVPADVPPVDEVLADRLPLLRPLSIFPGPSDGRLHLTVLTDSLSSGSLFGGVGTSMILAAMLARRLGASLRVVTRLERPDAANFGLVLRAHRIDWNDNVEFSYSPIDGRGASLPWRAGEVFLTTSWWSTWSALQSVDPKRIVYLLQEDERLFYPSGDEQIACSEVLADPRLRFAVNTALLRDHLVAEGFENVAANGRAFEPAFPDSIYFRERDRVSDRRRFFFYARPNNPRNLFVRGLEAVKEALAREIITPEGWELHFVGSGVPSVVLPHGVRPTVSEHLPWAAYAALLRQVDVGLSLMSSPHPSYPPLDLAACGAVAVTNRFGPKQSLERYSENILCADLDRDSLVACISAAVLLAGDEAQRARNYENQRLSRSWSSSFDPLVDDLAAWL